MPSYISNFNRQTPKAQWLHILGLAIFIFVSFVSFMEISLNGKSHSQTITDSEGKWARQRALASHLGKHALILVGASRFQLDMDLDVLRQSTGLEPVQLAITGSPFEPVLAGLAADPTIRGTVLVDYYDHNVGVNDGIGAVYERNYETRRGAGEIEELLENELHEHLLSYHYSGKPLNALRIGIMGQPMVGQNMTVLPDRSILADYKSDPNTKYAYYHWIIKLLGVDINPKSDGVENILSKKVSLVTPKDNKEFIKNISAVRTMVSEINSHGGRVIFIKMPSSGMYREFEDRRYPRKQFSDIFSKNVGAKLFQSEDFSTLKNIVCPDGSHLDYRNRSQFTTALVQTIDLGDIVRGATGANLATGGSLTNQYHN